MKIPFDRINKNNRVDLWDLGPQVGPRPPAAPEEPDKSKLKGVELAAAEVAFEDATEDYRNSLRAWNAARKEHRDWLDRIGGPVKLQMWHVEAKEAMEIEPIAMCSICRTVPSLARRREKTSNVRRPKSTD